ncbi:MAG: hypothetical protein DI637_13005 [Citromicrobium sp.]|nr:MAG: hypothetical protein DI637_13005 [Citromicrobium sp.]
MRVQNDAVSWKAAGFLLAWTGLLALFSWLGFNRLEDANKSGYFQYLWHGVGEDNLPWLFASMKGFLMVWSWVTLVMAVFGVTWFGIVLIKLLIRGAR